MALSLLVMVMCVVLALRCSASAARKNVVKPAKYSSVAEGLALKRVVLVHRHGDRSQISPQFGPNHAENELVREAWFKALPTLEMRAIMKRAAVTAADKIAPDPADLSLEGSLYSGFDRESIPYGQLTQIGALQLQSLGNALRARYEHHFPDLDARKVHVRSSNMCRTVQSVRCLLSSLLRTEECRPSAERPFIHAIPKKVDENMFPQEQTCPALVGKRLAARERAAKSIPHYLELEMLLKDRFGYDQVPWTNVFEILHCHRTHSIVFHPDTASLDLPQLETIVLYIWTQMYSDPSTNRLAIGRFLYDMLSDIRQHHNKQFLIYSGHDSTLVPLLCALGVFDHRFPSYASYAALEFATRKDGSTVVRIVYNDHILQDWTDWSAIERRLEALAISPQDFHRLCH